MCLIYCKKTRHWSALCAHTHTHTCVSQTAFSTVQIPRPSCCLGRLSPTLGASYLSWPMSPFTHTLQPHLLRGRTAVSEQACPLRSADRALIWRPMPRKRLIKAGRWEGGRALSRRVKASQLPGLIGRGAGGKLLGRDWVTWWLSFSTVTRCTFTHSPPWVCCSSKNSALWCAKPPQICPTGGEPGEPDVILFFLKQKNKGGSGTANARCGRINWATQKGPVNSSLDCGHKCLVYTDRNICSWHPSDTCTKLPHYNTVWGTQCCKTALSSFLFGSWGFFSPVIYPVCFFFCLPNFGTKQG